jgi:hypothetical protein
MTKRRVVWNSSERRTIYRELVYMFTNDPKLDDKTAFYNAQFPFPMERRRLATYAAVYAMSDEIKRARREAETTPPEVVSVEPPPVPVDPILQLVETLVGTLADRITERVVRDLADRLSPIRSGIGGDYPFPPEKKPANGSVYPGGKTYENPPTPLKYGVLIVGLNRLQIDTIIRGFSDHFSLRFLSAEEAVSSPVLFRAYTILMTKFISHAVQDKYRKNPGLIYCNGGVSALEEALKSILASCVPA